jgi:hypothetical protein
MFTQWRKAAGRCRPPCLVDGSGDIGPGVRRGDEGD